MLSLSSLIISSFGLLSINTLNGVIQGTTNTLTTIYQLLPSSTQTLENTYKKQIKDLNIEIKLAIISNWLKEPKHIDNTSENFKLIYSSISEMCVTISNTLDKINLEIINHNNKWFSSWRKLDLDLLLVLLEKQSYSLTDRIQMINLL